MSYCVQRDDSTIDDALRRIAREQIDKALVEAGGSDIVERRAAVHALRKRCKRLRGLLRLVRPGLKDFERENAALRDAARSLSELRDAQVLVDTMHHLLSGLVEQEGEDILRPIGAWLSLRRDAVEQTTDIDGRLEACVDVLRCVRERCEDWRLKEEGFDAVEGGIAKTYGRARHAMHRALESGAAEDFHAWRKRVKYHRFHTALLMPIWEKPMAAHCEAADRLADGLGRHHDLAVLAAVVAGDSSPLRGARAGETAMREIARRQARLEGEAALLGGRLLAEPPEALLRRWRSYWQVWQDERDGSSPEAADAA